MRKEDVTVDHFDTLVRYTKARGLPIQQFIYSRGFYIRDKDNNKRGVLVYNADSNTFDTWLDKKKHTSYRKGRSLESVKRMVRKLTEQPKPRFIDRLPVQPIFEKPKISEGEFIEKGMTLNAAYKTLIEQKINYALYLEQVEQEIQTNIAAWNRLVHEAGVQDTWKANRFGSV
jgi:hypothetical protein